jgi:hypothetical protein
VTHTTDPLHITHRLPDLTDLTFEVTLRDTTREDRTTATINYPAGVDLSDYTVRESYPIAKVEAAVSMAVGHSVTFAGCTYYGTDIGGDTTVEVWDFTPSR